MLGVSFLIDSLNCLTVPPPREVSTPHNMLAAFFAVIIGVLILAMRGVCLLNAIGSKFTLATCSFESVSSIFRPADFFFFSVIPNNKGEGLFKIS
jgi:hypothetical protein